MIEIGLFILYCFMIILILVFLIAGAYYQRQFEQCFNSKIIWCHTDWKCLIGDDVTQDQLNRMKEAKIVPADAEIGDSYEIRNIVDQLLTNCKTTTDDAKLRFVNSITGAPCIEGEPNCATVPVGCLDTLYSQKNTKELIWGLSGIAN